MWCHTSPQARQLGPRLNTIWHQKTASQAVNGSAAAWLVLPPRWPTRHRISDSSDQIVSKRSGRAASACHLQTGAEQQKTGPKSPPLFSKKWASTQANTRGLATVTRTKTTTSTSGCAASDATECYGIRSTARSARSHFAPSWRSNLN